MADRVLGSRPRAAHSSLATLPAPVAANHVVGIERVARGQAEACKRVTHMTPPSAVKRLSLTLSSTGPTPQKSPPIVLLFKTNETGHLELVALTRLLGYRSGAPEASRYRPGALVAKVCPAGCKYMRQRSNALAFSPSINSGGARGILNISAAVLLESNISAIMEKIFSAMTASQVGPDRRPPSPRTSARGRHHDCHISSDFLLIAAAISSPILPMGLPRLLPRPVPDSRAGADLLLRNGRYVKYHQSSRLYCPSSCLFLNRPPASVPYRQLWEILFRRRYRTPPPHAHV